MSTPAKAVALAQAIDRSPGLRFGGLMTYPPKNSVRNTNTWLTKAVDLCKRSGIAVETVSNGGTPDLYSAHEVTVATEHRPGTYIYSDRYHVETHSFGDWGDCALCAFRLKSCPTLRPTAELSMPDRRACPPTCLASRAMAASSSIWTGKSTA